MSKKTKGGLMAQMRTETESLRRKYDEAVREIMFLHRQYEARLKEAQDRTTEAMMSSLSAQAMMALMVEQRGVERDGEKIIVLDASHEPQSGVTIRGDKEQKTITLAVKVVQDADD